MIGRVLLAALLAGIAAGLLMGVIQHVRLTPLIVQAETYEHAAVPMTEDQGHVVEPWVPTDGWERTFFTALTAMLTGAGFAAILAGLSFLLAIPVTRGNGLIWGLCGFVAVSLAPAAGLPPELPGMPAADLLGRQIWWAGTIFATGFGLWLLTTRREAVAVLAAIAVIAFPHVIGAPQIAAHESTVPASLAASFVANSLAANAVFWAFTGYFLSLALEKFQGLAKS